MGVLGEAEVQERLRGLPGWVRDRNGISKEYEFRDFVAAMGFVQQVALLAQRADHHPDIHLRWSRVTLVLTTHSEGGLTERDFKLAAQIDRR
ncbi:MAG: 4a-hydroxytetrahydrobiopterin dehydratase [Dehalococcoidia bacterium]|nr:4a-hydroxytetrahydrobiopterin dehydratase [Dehalococcoidia bacterium]